MRLPQEGTPLNSGTNCHSWALVAPGTFPGACKVNALKTVGIDNQSTPADAAPDKIVPSVPDDEPDIVGSCKINTCLDVIFFAGHDDIYRVVAKRA